MNLGKLILGALVVGGVVMIASKAKAGGNGGGGEAGAEAGEGTAAQVQAVAWGDDFPQTAVWKVWLDPTPGQTHPWKFEGFVTNAYSERGNESTAEGAYMALDMFLKENGYQR